jgi:hypothetical protein
VIGGVAVQSAETLAVSWCRRALVSHTLLLLT